MSCHSIYVGSTHAVKVDANGTEMIIPADNAGNITVSAGDVQVFKNYTGTGNLAVIEIMFKTSTEPLQVQFNDNSMYTFIVPAASQRGISDMPIYRVKVMNDSTFAYDALA